MSDSKGSNDDDESNETEVPFHVLMSEDLSKRRLDRRLQRDYLSKRFQLRAQLAKQKEGSDDGKSIGEKSENPSEKLWSGASSLEKSLIGCCCCASSAANENGEDDPEEDSLVAEALLRSKICHFLGIISVEAHDLPSRALALAILEKTHELDERIYQAHEIAYAELPQLSEDEKIPSSSTSRSNGSMKNIDVLEIPSATIKPPPPRRVMKFIRAGGLRLLSRWLMEACETREQEVRLLEKGSRSASRQQQARASKKRYVTKPSRTGTLLLPLLRFLAQIPFDRQAITESKINKRIKRLSKDVKEILTSGPSNGIKRPPAQASWTDPVTGGLDVIEVQDAVKVLMSTWEEQAKNKASVKNQVPNPFAAIAQLVKKRLGDYEKYESGLVKERPTWLADPIEEPLPKKRKKSTRKVSAQKLAQLERENEKKALMKADLTKAQAARRELLRKLREMKNQQAEETRRIEAISTSKRRVRWKDGLDSAALTRKRELLEDVRVFVKDKYLISTGTTENDDDDEDMFAVGEDV